MGATIPTGRNLFDYEVRYSTDVILLFKFTEEQHRARRFWEDTLYEMCNESGYNSVECRPMFDLCLSKVMVY